MQNSIELINITKSFDSKTVVNNVSFAVPQGKIFGFLGPNGSGKSTIMKMLCGILTPTSGQCYIESLDPSANSHKIKYLIGYMSQHFSLYPDLTARENLLFYGRLYGLRDNMLNTRIEELSQRTSLYNYLDYKAKTLSGGWKQRLSLTCALLHSPRVLFLDEPTAGIDPVARYEVWELLKQLTQEENITVFVSTHYMDEAEKCDYLGFIYLGDLIICDTVQNIKDKYNSDLETIFVQLTREQQALKNY